MTFYNSYILYGHSNHPTLVENSIVLAEDSDFNHFAELSGSKGLQFSECQINISHDHWTMKAHSLASMIQQFQQLELQSLIIDINGVLRDGKLFVTRDDIRFDAKLDLYGNQQLIVPLNGRLLTVEKEFGLDELPVGTWVLYFQPASEINVEILLVLRDFEDLYKPALQLFLGQNRKPQSLSCQRTFWILSLKPYLTSANLDFKVGTIDLQPKFHLHESSLQFMCDYLYGEDTLDRITSLKGRAHGVMVDRPNQEFINATLGFRSGSTFIDLHLDFDDAVTTPQVIDTLFQKPTYTPTDFERLGQKSDSAPVCIPYSN
jgi:hypothetical protein